MNRRGFTLLEVLMASAIMLTLVAVTLAAFSLGWSAQKTRMGAQDSYRSCLLAQSRLREILQAVQVLSPAKNVPADRLTFRYAKVVDGNLQVDYSGEPLWGGNVTISTDSQGNLTSQEAGQPLQILCRLGSGGKANFSREGPNLLAITIHTERRDPQGPANAAPIVYDVKDLVYLPNQF